MLPNFFFHVTTAFNILRHNGLAIGKRDFLGAVPLATRKPPNRRGRLTTRPQFP